ncbi:hypothetical protein pb186bvf_016872 [Paramecium bursaria]
MRSLVICAILLLATANAASLTQKYPFNYSKKRSIMAVMMEVEAKLKSKSPLDAILNVLNDFRDAVNTEQVNHDEIYNVQQTECASEHEFRSKQVTDASNVLRDSSAQLSSCETQKARTSNQFNVNEQQTFSNEEHLNIVLATRDAEEAYFKKRSQDYEDALHAIDEASDILTSIYSGSGSFAEVARVSKTMLQNAINVKATLQYAPVLSALAQLAAKERQLDESALERVAQLLETLRKNVQQAYSDFSAGNAVAVAAFNDQKDRLKVTLGRLERQHDRLQDKLDALNQCIGTQSAIAQTASQKLQRNTQLWDQAKALCSTFDNEYNYATQTRRQELQLVTQLEELVEKRFAQVDDENAERAQRLGL